MKKILALALLLASVVPAPLQAARIITAGAELNTTTGSVEVTGVTTPITVTSSFARSGTYSWELNLSNATGERVFQRLAANQSTAAYMRFYIYCTATTSASVRFINFNNSANTGVSGVRWNNDGTFSMTRASGTFVGTSTATLPLNQWVRMEFMHAATSTPGNLELRMNGVNILSGQNSSQGTWARALFGLSQFNTTAHCYFDDFALNDSSGASQNSWPGEGKVILLSPNAAGDLNGWNNTANGAGSVNNYTLVDETPPNDATDHVQSGTLNATDWYNVSHSNLTPYDTISAVIIGGRVTNNIADATAAVRWQAQKRTGGTVAQGTAIIPNVTSTWRTDNADVNGSWASPFVLYNDPDGSPWTSDTLNSMQIGPKITAANTNRIQVSRMWAYVDYVEGVPPGQTAIIPRFQLNLGQWFQNAGTLFIK